MGRLLLGGGDLTRAAPPVARRVVAPPAVTQRRPVSEGVSPALGDERGFVHKRLLGGIKGFIRGGPQGAIGGFLAPGAPRTTIAPPPIFRRPGIAQPTSAPISVFKFLSPEQQRKVVVATGIQGCPPGFFRDAGGNCIPLQEEVRQPPVPGLPERILKHLPVPEAVTDLIFPPAPARPFAAGAVLPQAAEFGEAVMGQFGAGLEPAVMDRMVRQCPRGSVLGADGLCYNKGAITNRQRFWPRGARPLLTGGEMRAIGVASRAAGKVERKTKQLQKLGMLRRPTRRGAPKLLPAGHRATLEHG